MQAIQTKVVQPSATKGAHLVARAGSRKVKVAYDHSLDLEANHVAAAEALRNEAHWGREYGSLVTGCLPDQSYCHVFVRAAEFR